MKMNFEAFSYYPALRSRAAELLGLKQLNQDSKKSILPLITLGKWPKAENIQASLDKTIESMGELPFFLDITRETSHHNNSSMKLLDPSNGFSNWQEFLQQTPQIIPVVQMPENARVRDITLQAKAFEKNRGCLAFRIINLESDIERAISALVALDTPENAMVFIDLGYIRNAVPVATSAAIRVINRLREEIPEATIALLSTSFPQSVTSFATDSKGTHGSIDIQERELFESIGGSDVAIYGDHGSIHSVVYPDSGGRFVPRIDLPLDDVWYFERRPDTSSEGYIDAARAILEKYPWLQELSEWGAEVIREAAHGNIAGMGSPAKWIAVRVNLHLARQIELSNALINAVSFDEDF